MRSRIPLLPLGEPHPDDRCSYCGARASRYLLRQATLPTLAIALVCADVCDCERRRYRLKNGITTSTAGRWAA